MATGKTSASEGQGGSTYAEALNAYLPRIRDLAPQINEERRVPQDLVDEMVAEGLFRLLVPASVGGIELDYLDYLSMVESLAAADGSTAWCFNQNNILGTFASLMPKALAQEIWSDPNAVVCNGPPQYATIKKVDGGFSLSGRWNFSSGSHHANWTLAIGKAEHDGELWSFFMPKENFTFLDTWQVSGLRGTGSFSFECEDLFVPESHGFVEAKSPPHEPGPLYMVPRNLMFASGFASIGLGIARGALDYAIETSLGKTPQEQALLREQSLTQRQIGEAEAIWGAARAFLREKAGALWQSARERGEVTVAERIALRLASTHAIRQASEVTDIAYSVGGASSIFESNGIQRKFQDSHAVTQQIQGRMEHYETAGQFFLGLEPKGRLF